MPRSHKEINSGPFINNAYEINRRIVLVLRLLGVGIEGINLFCGLMDLGQGLSVNAYYSGENSQRCETNIRCIMSKSSKRRKKRKCKKWKVTNEFENIWRWIVEEMRLHFASRRS